MPQKNVVCQVVAGIEHSGTITSVKMVDRSLIGQLVTTLSYSRSTNDSSAKDVRMDKTFADSNILLF